MRATLKLEILTYWQCGTAGGWGLVADSAAQRDELGLPMVPGKTVRGLLREAMRLAEETGVVSKGRTNVLFGSDIPVPIDAADGAKATDAAERAIAESRFKTQAGKLSVGSARMGQAWRDWARGGSDAREELFTLVARTAIGEDGLALDRTLRTDECAVPMGLTAELEGPDDAGDWPKELHEAARLFLRALGSHRNRGFGRVDASVTRAS